MKILPLWPTTGEYGLCTSPQNPFCVFINIVTASTANTQIVTPRHAAFLCFGSIYVLTLIKLQYEFIRCIYFIVMKIIITEIAKIS
jgi:hypothetical protein